ncbi:VOC family protein [Ichthyenterobacterium magnum]|nr:VOC family protein [Ichthyenterobacterium magnum]
MKLIKLLIINLFIIFILFSCDNKEKTIMEKENGMKIGLTTIFTNDLDQMKIFFNDKMGIPIENENSDFIEFKIENYRFAVGLRESMYKTLKDSTYLGKRKGAAVGIGFFLSSKEKVDSTYMAMKKNGVFFNQEPKLMPWNEYTAFFKDPDGNIHELISEK